MAIKISGVTIIDDSRNIVSGAAATFTSNVTIGGTLTYEDVTNIDSVGVITAREGIRIPNTKQIQLGDSQEFSFFNNTNSAEIQHTGSGFLFISGNDIALRSLNQKAFVVCDADNEVSLYFNNSPKFQTTNTGVEVIHAGGGVLNVTTLNATDGDFAGIVTAQGFVGGGINTLSESIFKDMSVLGGININGVATATAFSGDGSNLTNLPVSSFFTNTDVGIHTLAKVGIGTTNPIAQLDVNVGSSVTALNIEGSEGQLFSVTNNLSSGSIFAVNDITGLPSVDVNADGTIQLAPRGAGELVGIGTTTPTSKLHLVGDALITGVVTATKYFGDAQENFFVGVNAGSSNNLAACNIAIGHSAGNGLCGCDNIILGSCAGNGFLLGGSTQTRNVLIGKQAGQCSASSVNNVYLGYGAGRFNTSAVNNIGIGYAAIRCPGSGSGNVALGSQAMRNATGGSNVALGGAAGCNVTGCYNVFLGCGSGSSTTSGEYNIILGHQVQASSVTADSELVIGCCTGRWVCGDSSFNTTLAGISTAKADGTFLSKQLNVAGVSTFSNDINLLNDKKVKFGTMGFQIYQNTSPSNNAVIQQSAAGQFLRLVTNGGALSLESDYVNLRNSANNADVASFDADGAATLRFNSNPKFLTKTDGAAVVGILTANGLAISGVTTVTGDLSVSGTIDGTGAIGSRLFQQDSLTNMIAGTNAGLAITVGTSPAPQGNILIGQCAGSRINTSCLTVAIGKMAGACITGGSGQNTLIGSTAGQKLGCCGHTNGNGNTFMGMQAGKCGYNPVYNTFIGYGAGMGHPDSTGGSGGSCNVAIGFHAAGNMRSGHNNVSIGRYTGVSNSTGDNNFASGNFALACNLTGSNHIAIGKEALSLTCTGGYNIALGNRSLYCNTTATFNIGIGYYTLLHNTTFGGSIAIGCKAGCCALCGPNIMIGEGTGMFLNGCHNTLLGTSAGTKATEATGNTFIGRLSGGCNTTGSKNVSVGWNAGYGNTTGSGNINVGRESGALSCGATGSANISMGQFSGKCISSAQCNISIGECAACCLSTGGCNVAIGQNAGRGYSSGSINVSIGQNSGAQNGNSTGSGNITIGKVGECISSGSANIAIGCGVNMSTGNVTGDSNISIGPYAGRRLTSGGYNTFIGSSAGRYTTSGGRNQFIGISAGSQNQTGCENTAIGCAAGSRATSGNHNTSIGRAAGFTNVTGHGNVAVGHSAGYGNRGSNNISIGATAGPADSCTDNVDNILIGRQVGSSLTSGCSNIFMGVCAGVNAGTATSAIVIGNCAGKCFSPSLNQHGSGYGNIFVGEYAGKCVTTGIVNVLIGKCAGCCLHGSHTTIAIGANAGAKTCAANDNVLIGTSAGECNTTGATNVMIGNKVGRVTTTGSNNIFLGQFAGCYNLGGTSNVYVGNCSGYKTQGHDNVMLGLSAGFNRCGSKFCRNVLVGRSAGGSCGTLAIGNFDVFIGYAAGKCYTGTCSIGIGHSVRMPITDGTNQLAIGQDTCHWITGTCDYNIGIGTTNPTSKLSVAGDACVSGVSTFSDTLRVGAGVTLNRRGDAAFAGVVTFSACTSSYNDNGAIHLPTCRMLTFGSDYLRGAIWQAGAQLTFQALNSYKFCVWDGGGFADWLNVYGVTGSINIGGCSMGVSGSTNKTPQINVCGAKHCIVMKSSVPDSTTQTDRFELNSYGIKLTGITTVAGNVNVTGVVTATHFYGDGSNLTGISGGGGGISTTFFASSAAGIHTLSKVGIGTAVPEAQLDVNVGASITALNISGSEGQLFSVTNNLTSGSIFEVNDVSGMPSIDVNADGTIQLAPHGTGELVGIGTTSPTSKLHVVGTLTAEKYKGDTNRNIIMGVDPNTVATSGVGTGNVFIGDSAGLCNTDGRLNVFIGNEAGKCNTTSTHNVAIGNRAGCCLKTGGSNTIVGTSAGHNLCSGTSNVFLGSQAALCATTTQNSVVIGLVAGKSLTTGTNNVLVGRMAGCQMHGGSSNVMMGNCAGYCVQGHNNVMLGSNTGFHRAGAKYRYNTLLGNYAGRTAGTLAVGNFDVLLGYLAGECYTGTCSIGIGHSLRMPITAGTNQLAIGQETNYWITGSCDYNVGIGISIPTSKLHVVGDTCVSGVSTVSGGVCLPNNSVLTLGQGSYKTTFHADGTNTHLCHSGLSAFLMRSNDFQIRGAGVRAAGLSYDDTIFRVRTGIVELGYEFGNGSAGMKLRTSGIGITVTGQIDTTDINATGIITATNFTKTDGTPIASTDIAINTLSSSSGTGGGSASFNGTAYRFTLSEPPDTSVYQLQVSINGVIQKPNAGSSQPSEGFAIDGNDIIFGSPPPAGSPFFITTFKTVGISSIPPQAQVSTTSAAKSVKNVTTSTSAPTNSNGVDGDLWFTYIA